MADVPSYAGSAAGETPSTVGRLLEGLARGDPAALDALVAVLYDELRIVAHRQRRRWRGDDTLGTTALLHETYLKLRRQKRIGTESRDHFLALASRAMRHILSTCAEQRRTLKRGSAVGRVPVTGVELPAAESPTADEVLITMNDALRRMEAVHPRQCRVVECRFYGGLSVEEAAAALALSPRTIKRDWAFAQAWLKRELGELV
ncbi:MAG TPA: ECF-type sigma factor [Vicinamibacterales bacterium]|nr:ECF-type sigma factor [Vicinamibacterales bacterium]